MSLFRFSFYPLFGSYALVLGLIVVLGICLLAVLPHGEQLSRRGRRWLMALRAVSLILLAFAMLRPTLVYTKTQPLAATLTILLDESESMSRSDELAGNTRFHAAKTALLEAQPQLKKLQDRAEIQAFAFDSALRPLEVRAGAVEGISEQPVGMETAIGTTLDAVRERSAGKRIIGTVLLSDGTQRTRPPRDVLPHDAAVRLRDAGIPLYAVSLGQASGTPDIQDIAVNDIQANERVFEKNTFLVSGSLRITGYPDQPIPVRLLFEDESGIMQPVAEVMVRSRKEGQDVPFRLTYAPPKVGYYKYTVEVPTQEKELIETNNRQSNFVRVIGGGLTVLYIQGERNVDQGHLLQSLNASADIDVTYRPYRVGRIRAAEQARSTFESRLEQATRERESRVDENFAPGKYNAYILDSLDSKAFKPEELQALADRVREGAGLILLGGHHAFGAGGYSETPLAAVSPVELRKSDVQPLDGPLRQDIHWQLPMTIRLTPEGRRHYVMRLTPDPNKNAEIWAELPPLDGANRLGKLKPGATLLAEGPQQQPLLVSQLFGLGRVLAFAGDTTYRWRLAGFPDQHKLFWRQVVLWLAKMENVLEGDCWITLDNVRLMPGETAKFRVFMKNSGGEEVRHFSAQATVVKPDGTEERVALVDEEGTPTGSFRSTTTPGDYTIRVEATHESLPADNPSREAAARFMVYERNLELDNPVAYPQLLKSISELTGGYSLAPEQLPKLIDELMKKSDELVEKRETKRSLYDGWGLLLAFVLVMGLEWFLRKYWGLV